MLHRAQKNLTGMRRQALPQDFTSTWHHDDSAEPVLLECPIESNSKPRKAGESKDSLRGTKLLELAVLLCLVGAAVGIIKALHMERSMDALFLLSASIAVSTFVSYLYFQKD